MLDQSWKEHSRWDRADLKKRGRAAVLRNYTDTLLVSAIYILFGIGYGSSTINVASNPGSGHTGQMFLDSLAFKEVFSNIFHRGDFFLFNIWNQFLSYSSPLTDGLRHLGSAFAAKTFSSFFFSMLAVLLVLFFTLFVQNILIVGNRRYFLENRVYHKTQLSRVLYVYKKRRVKKVAWVMFVKSVFQILWCLTVVGGIVKFYSYRLVPFILAENPSISATGAITLSRALMDGNKWRWFLMDITFLPLRFLSGATFQLAGLVYIYGYIRSTEAFLYADLREKAKTYQLIGAGQLDDDLLYPSVSTDEPARSQGEYYPDYAKNMEEGRFLAYYGRHYTILHLIILFFVFSIFGWVWEVSLNLLRDGIFVNRGFYHGPWLPIYGSGGTLILILLKKLRHSVFLTFLATIVICGVLEYATSWAMEKTLGQRWWDYSGYLFNINGRVCLEVLLMFAVGGCALVYLIAPKVDDFLQKIPVKEKIPIVVIVILLFSSDAYYTSSHHNEGNGITSENGNLGSIRISALHQTLQLMDRGGDGHGKESQEIS